MATGQSKIYLDIEARLRGNEDIKGFNNELKNTEKAAEGADTALVKAAKTLGLIPPTRAQNSINNLTKAFDELKNAGQLSAEEIDFAYEKTLAKINKISAAGAGERFAEYQGRASPSEIKAQSEAEIDAARKTAEVKKTIAEDNASAEKRFAEETRKIQQSEAENTLATDKYYQEQRFAAQKAQAERIQKLESDAADRRVETRNRLDEVLSKNPKLAEQLRKEDAVVPVGPIRESTRALAEQDKQLAKNGITARQTAAAMRQLPAQFSDIVVSLQGGQAPLTVFLQQGAQIKDSFGGAGNAVRAFGGYVAGLVNPITVAGAALVGFTALIYSAQKAQQELAASIVLNGNAIGSSISELTALSKSIAESTNTTVGTATDALVVFAKAGSVSAENIGIVTEAAIKLEKVGGPALKDTADLMTKISTDPQKGLDELAKKFGIVSLAINDQVKELIELGKQEEAVALAQRFAAEETLKRVEKVVSTKGSLLQFTEAVSAAFKSMWNAISNLGREDDDYLLDRANARLETLEKRKTDYEKRIFGGLSASLLTDEINKEKDLIKQLGEKIKTRDDEAKKEGEITRTKKEAAEAQARINKTIGEGASKQEQLNSALKKYREDIKLAQEQGAKFTDADIKKGEAAIREKFKETAKAATGATRSIVNTFKVESLEGKKILLEMESLATERKRLYDQNLVDLDTFYNGQRTLIEEQAKLEKKNLDEQKARLEGELKTADPNQKIRLNNEISKIEFDSTKYQLQASEKLAALEVERSKAAEKTRTELQNINQLYLSITNQGTSAEAAEARRLDIAQKYSAIVDQINTALSRRDVANADELLARRQQIEAIQEQELALQNLAAAQQQNQVNLTSNTVEQVQIQSELQRGLISQIEAEARLNELKRQALELQIATQQAAIDSGKLQGEALSKATIAVAELRAQLEQTTPTVQAFGDQFKVLFEDRIAGALGDVLTRTKSFKDAFRGLLAGIAQDVARNNIGKLISAAFDIGKFIPGSSSFVGPLPAGTSTPLQLRANGGFISGPGTGTSDSIPARLSNGEYVIRASSVQKFGKDFFDSLNAGSLGRMTTRVPSVPNGFANGGQVSVASQDVNIQVINQSSQPVRARQEQDPRTGVVQVILEDLNRGGPISRGINGITGTGRAVTR